ncbi:uncharacterized protein [Ptychodera flava]|uniref:uncharacterized protein isoform X2 n=1 Tax=Ptychodera flava TaxID=63121 RepID=UPI00396A499D
MAGWLLNCNNFTAARATLWCYIKPPPAMLYRLKKLKLNRTSRASYHEVHNAIQIELNSSGAKLGYRSMWRRLKRKYCLNVSRQTVAETLKTLDPDGVEARSKKRFKRGVYRSAGPNQTWHLDG